MLSRMGFSRKRPRTACTSAKLFPVLGLGFITCVIFLGVIYLQHGSVVTGNLRVFIPEKLAYHPEVQSDLVCVASLSFEKRETIPVLRALVAFFSVYQMNPYLGQLKWCMRSLLEMMKTEPVSWRTDLILYVEDTTVPELTGLGCSTEARRTAEEPFRCVLVKYVRVSNRTLSLNASEYDRDLTEELADYEYANSIVPLAEQAEAYLKYDVVIKSDLDTFLTPAFSKWLPPDCAFLTGDGEFNTPYNMDKLERVAKLNNVYFNSSIWHIGSTWIGPGPLVAKIAQRAVHWMVYLSKHEFPPITRYSSWWSTAQLWPDWHYGVLSLYGSQLAVNEVLQGGKLYPFRIFDLDYPTYSTRNCTENGPVHLHTYHIADYFSKEDFENGLYVGPRSLPRRRNSTLCRDYAGYIAGDSARMSSTLLRSELRKAKLKKEKK